MTKMEMIEKYGEEFYEQHKKRCKLYQRDYFRKDPETYKEKKRKYYRNHKTEYKEYGKKNALIYKINTRDRYRLIQMNKLKPGEQIHHMKYHKQKDDEDWINDIMIMTKDEHKQWHRDHPEFIAAEHVV